MHPQPAPSSPLVELEPGQLLRLEGRSGRIHLTHGQVWLTESGDPRDVVLAAGDGWGLDGRALLLGALAPTRLLVCDAAAGLRSGAVSLWRHTALALQRQLRREVTRQLTRQVTRLQFGPVEVPPWR